MITSFINRYLCGKELLSRGSRFHSAGLILPFESPSNVLTLSLLMLRVGTNDHNFAVSANDLALFAHRLY